MDNAQVIAAFTEELKALTGKSIPQKLYDEQPRSEHLTPGLYQVENIRPDLYPGVGVSYLLLREDASGLLYTDDLMWYDEYKRPNYNGRLEGEGLEMLVDYERCGTCRVSKLA